MHLLHQAVCCIRLVGFHACFACGEGKGRKMVVEGEYKVLDEESVTIYFFCAFLKAVKMYDTLLGFLGFPCMGAGHMEGVQIHVS